MTGNDLEPAIGLEQFELLRFEVAEFDHRSHVYVGWLYLQRFDLRQTQRRYGKTLRTLTESLGVPDKYHQTMTFFLLALIDARRRAAPQASWPAFVNANPDLFHNVRETLLRHYSSQRLQSLTAKRRYLPPDRRPLNGSSPTMTSAGKARSAVR